MSKPRALTALTWTEKAGSDGVTRIGKDKHGVKRVENHIGVDGATKCWYHRADGTLEYFEQFRAGGVLELERHYDRRGVEKECAGYSERGWVTFRSHYDPDGDLIRQAKWAENGNLREETEFRKGLRHGTATTFSTETGRLLSRIEYRGDRQDGLSEVYYETPHGETLRARAWYQDGRIEGEYSNFHVNGRLEEAGEIRDGRHVGVRTWYYENGRIRSRHRYDDGELHGDIEEYDEHGMLRRKVGMRRGQKHGLEVCYTADGQVESREGYLEGRWTDDFGAVGESAPPDGVFELVHENGRPKSKISYRQGRRHGPFRHFDEEGRLREEGEYADGELTGVLRRYRVDGTPAEEISYRNGVKSGASVRFSERGQAKVVEEYENGRLATACEYYDNGQLWWSRRFSGEGLCALREYDDSGLLLLDAELQHNRWHGRVRSYAGNGSLRLVAHYAHGQLEGEWTMFWPNGRVRERRYHQEGRAIEFAVYNRYGQLLRLSTYHPDGSVISDEVFVPPKPDAIEEDEGGMVPGASVGEYELVRLLGRGGMGEVYLAREKSTGTFVAIKTVSGYADQAALIRFLAEARALAKIRHENVIAILNVGNHAGKTYIAMEYVEGGSLSCLLGVDFLSMSDQLRIFRQMVLGVQAAHAAGILHRDLKPANILVSERLTVKLIDFGIARVPVNLRLNVSAPPMIIGTVSYLSPEVAAGHPATVQTDIYGLGVILFEMLTGQVPFRGSSPAETLEKIKSEPLVFPDTVRDRVLPELADLVLRMTARNPVDRPADAAAVLSALDALDLGRAAGMSGKDPGGAGDRG